MGRTVLREISKITKPLLECALPRPGLFERLDRVAAHRAIAWVSAPAGSGKTVLLASWLEARRRPTLWYQIDARDADPASFFYFVGEAATRLARRKRVILPLLTPEYAHGLEAYARSFFEQLGRCVRPGTVIVLDDYHELPEGSPLHVLMPLALASLPPSSRVLVASRSPPPAPFARLQAHGQLGLVDARELTLTVAETRDLARLHGRDLSDSEAESLTERTDGWMAGTTLLLQAGSGQRHAEGVTEGTEPRDVLFEYFASELFDRLPRTVRRFLLETAILPRMSTGAAEALTGAGDADEILSSLVRRNCFTVRLSGHEARYRYHPLFREFLLARARGAHTSEQWRALTRRATDVLLGDGGAEHAPALMIASGDHASLAHLVVERAPALVAQGRLLTAETWLRALPAEIVRSSGWLGYWLGQCESARYPAAGRDHLERAYALFKASGDATGEYHAWAGYVATFIYVWDRFDGLDPWLEELKALRGRHPSFPTRELDARVTFAALTAHMWRDASNPEIAQWVERARAMVYSDLPAELRMRLVTALLFYLVWWPGDHRGAVTLLKETQPLLREPDVTPATQILWRVMEAASYARAGETSACFQAVESGLATAERCGILGLNLNLAIQGAYGALGGGDLAAARRYHDRARAQLRPEEATNQAHFHMIGIWIALCAGDLPAAEAEAGPMLECAARCGADFANSWRPHTLAHLLEARGRHAEALAALAGALAWARQRENAPVEHHCLLSEAHVLLAGGREPEAIEKLREAMAFGRERGYVVHPWIGWRRDVMARLAAVALEHGIEADHVRAQVRAMRLAPPSSPAALEAWPWPVRVRTLGQFELWRGDERLDLSARAQRKPLELLQALIALGASEVREEHLADALWPDAEGDAARHALETTVYRLRKLVGAPEAVVQRDRKLSLDPSLCWVDAFALERGLRAALLRRTASPEEAERIARLYRGPFLPDAGPGLPSVATVRERLRRDLSRLLAAVEGSGAPHPPLRARLAGADADLSAAAARTARGEA
jgi:ATP/maltotriose-dependent transcriptional regulator MalT